MKKAFRIAAYVTGAFVLLLLVSTLAGYVWLSTKWKDFYTETEMQQLANKLNQTPPLPDNFYLAYNRVYPQHRYLAFTPWVWAVAKETVTNQPRTSDCYCRHLAFYQDKKIPVNYHSWRDVVFTYGIENYLTPKRCFEIYMRRGMEYYMPEFFNKPLTELTEWECVELIIRMERPSYYYLKHPEKLAEELAKYK